MAGKGVFIGIGSNIGNGVKNCMMAIKKISSDARAGLKSISSFYRTSPVSEIEQNDFVNCAVCIEWKDTPGELLTFLNGVEAYMGRTREIKGGPRVIDLDILLFDDVVLDEPSLVIPHKELHKRKFAIVPCLEIEPHIVHPRYKKPLNSFLPGIKDDQEINKLRGISLPSEEDGEK